jgi:WD40 repeat protein
MTSLSALIDCRERLIHKTSCWELDNILSHEYFYRNLQNVATLSGHRGCVNRLAFNEEGSLLLSGSDDCRLIVWDVAERTSRHQVETGHERNIFGVRFMPCTNDRLLASGAMDRTVRVNSLDGGTERLFAIHENRVKTIDVERRNPNLIFSASEDGTVKQIDLRSPEEPVLVVECSHPVKSAMLNPNFPFEMVVSCSEPTVCIYDRRLSYHSTPRARFCPAHLEEERLPFSTFSCFNETGTAVAASYCYEGVYVFSTQVATNEQSTNEQLHFSSDSKNRRNRILAFRYMLLSYECFNQNQFEKALAHISRAYNVYEWSPLLICRWILYCFRGWSGDVYCAFADMTNFFEQNPNQPEETPFLLSASTIRLFCFCFLDLQYLHRHLRDMRSVGKEMEEAVSNIVEKMEEEETRLARHLSSLEDVFPLKSWWSRIGKNLSQNRQLWTDNNICEFVQYWIGVMMQKLLRLSQKLTSETMELLQSALEHRVEDEQDERLILPLYLSTRAAKESVILEGLPSDCPRVRSLGYHKRFLGHLSMNTDIKEVSFISGKFPCLLSGSDDGCFYVWSLNSGLLVGSYVADSDAVNCVLPHPYQPLVATSGIDNDIQLWTPSSRPNILSEYDMDKRVNKNMKKLNEILKRPHSVGDSPETFAHVIQNLMRLEHLRPQDYEAGCTIL